MYKLTKLQSDSEQCATVGVLRGLLLFSDGVDMIEYFNSDEVTLIIDELCTNVYIYVLYSFVFSRIY